MRVRNHSAVYSTPGVNKKAPLLAVETYVRDAKQWVFVQAHVTIIDTTRARRSPPF